MFHQDLVSPLAMGAESEERLQQAVYYRGGVRIWRRGWRVKLSSSLLLVSLTFVLLCRHDWWVPRERLLELGSEITG